MTKNPKYTIFKVFMQFLSQFRQTPWIGMLKMFTNVAIRCPVVIEDEIVSVF